MWARQAFIEDFTICNLMEYKVCAVTLIDEHYRHNARTFNHKKIIFIQRNAFENVICKIMAIVPRHQCVKLIPYKNMIYDCWYLHLNWFYTSFSTPKPGDGRYSADLLKTIWAKFANRSFKTGLMRAIDEWKTGRISVIILRQGMLIPIESGKMIRLSRWDIDVLKNIWGLQLHDLIKENFHISGVRCIVGYTKYPHGCFPPMPSQIILMRLGISLPWQPSLSRIFVGKSVLRALL